MLGHSFIHNGPAIHNVSPVVIALLLEDLYIPEISHISNYDLAEDVKMVCIIFYTNTKWVYIILTKFNSNFICGKAYSQKLFFSKIFLCLQSFNVIGLLKLGKKFGIIISALGSLP